MGLASALAAQQAAQNTGQYPQQQQQPQAQQWSAAGAVTPGFSVAPAALTGPPPAQQQQPQYSPAGMQSVITARLDHIVKSNGLSAFYTPADPQSQQVCQLAQTIAHKVDFHQLAARCVTTQSHFNPLSIPMNTACYMHHCAR